MKKTAHCHVKVWKTLRSASAAGLLVAVIATSMGLGSLVPQESRLQQMIDVPTADAFGGSTWRRVRDEARRVRDRVRRELERAAEHAVKEARRATVRVQEGDFSVNLQHLQDQALHHIGTVASLTSSFIPASQVVQLALMTLEYERVVREMGVLDMAQAEIDRAEQRLNEAKQTLEQLENLRVGPLAIRAAGHVPPPHDSVQSAQMARLQYAQLSEYMGGLLLEAALYQHIHGQVPNRRPITLIYKIGQALMDYGQLKHDIKLISLSQSEHAGLFDAIITNGGLESVTPLLTNALTYLETMPVSGLPDTPINPQSHVGRLLSSVDTLELEGEQILAQHYDFPLMIAPSQTIAAMNDTLRDITHDPTNNATAWILLLSQHEVDALDEAQGRLQRMRDQLVNLHIHSPQELVGRFFFEALLLGTRYQSALDGLSRGEPTALAPEIREVHDHLEYATNIVKTQGLTLSAQLMSLIDQTLVNLDRAANDLDQRMATLLQEPLAEITSPSAVPGLPTVSRAVTTQTIDPAQGTVIAQELETALKQNETQRAAAMINHDAHLLDQTRLAMSAVKEVVEDNAGIGTLNAAINRKMTKGRLQTKSTAFQDSPKLGIHRDAIESLYAVGLLKGYPDGSFRPEKALNRSEMLKLSVESAFGTEFAAYEAAGGFRGTAPCFPDVPRGAWFENVVCFGMERGIIRGYPDGSFQPGAPVNFVEGLRLTLTAFGLPWGSNDQAWFGKDITFAKANGMIPADFTDNAAPLTRGQMASMLARAFVLSQEKQSPEDTTAPASAGTPRKEEKSHSPASDAGHIVELWDVRKESIPEPMTTDTAPAEKKVEEPKALPPHPAAPEKDTEKKVLPPLQKLIIPRSDMIETKPIVPATKETIETKPDVPATKEVPSDIPSQEAPSDESPQPVPLPAETSDDVLPLPLAAPRIVEPNPEQAYETSLSTVTIIGYMDARTAKLLLNGTPVAHKPGAGKFAVTAELVPGKNLLSIEAVDEQGNRTLPSSITVIYYQKSGTK